VKHEYRAHSLALHAKVVADKSGTVTNLSPTPRVLKLMEKLVGRVSQSKRIHVLGFRASARRRERKLAFRVPIKLADAGD
jgi:hypothetical protein